MLLFLIDKQTCKSRKLSLPGKKIIDGFSHVNPYFSHFVCNAYFSPYFFIGFNRIFVMPTPKIIKLNNNYRKQETKLSKFS